MGQAMESVGESLEDMEVTTGSGLEVVQDTAADLNMTEVSASDIKTAVEKIDDPVSGLEMLIAGGATQTNDVKVSLDGEAITVLFNVNSSINPLPLEINASVGRTGNTTYTPNETTRKEIQDLPAGFLTQTREAMAKVLEVCEQLEALVAANEIFLARTKGVGVLPPEVAAAYGVSGPNIRASGVKFDIRKVENYLPYDRFDWEVPVGENGDCWDRWWVRLTEIRQSASIIQQAVDGIPSGPLQAKVPKVIKVPEGQTYVRAENPKGEMGYYLVSDGGSGPYRLKIRSASFSNISILPWILEGILIPDIIAVMGSLDFVLGDVDR